MSSELQLPTDHNLSLPDWGPYSKRFFGLSHVADQQHGYRLDFTVMPGLYRRDIAIPDALKEAGYSPWECTPDLNYYSYRQQLEWRDQVYCDISFTRIDDHTRLIRCEGVNRTDMSNSLALHLVTSLELPPEQTLDVQLPAGAYWLNAADHQYLEFAVMPPRANLAYDGARRGEERCNGAVCGSVIGDNYGKNAGDRIGWNIKSSLSQAEIVLRYRMADQAVTAVACNGTVTELTGTGEFATAVIYRGPLTAGTLELISRGGNDLKLDGIAIGAPGLVDTLAFAPSSRDNMPTPAPGPLANSTVISFPLVKQVYGLWWSEDDAACRTYQVHDLKHTMLYDDCVHQKFMGNLNHGGKDRCVDVLIQPVILAPQQNKVVYAIICDGEITAVNDKLRTLDLSPAALEKIYLLGRANLPRPQTIAAGEAFRFSQERMEAVTMTNIVYPVYIKRHYIKHSPPGRCWNSLYTWDSGFIGLGLLEMDARRAMENLNAYVTQPGDQETAFIHHGTPLPVQHYLYQELWKRTGDREMLAYFYPRLKQFYRFLAGYAPSSLTRKTTTSGLLKTWDYFYNSGGWDDYPPQWFVHQHHLQHIVPAVSTSHAIRAAKILSQAANELGLKEDVADYAKDIAAFSTALQQHSWDAEAGYFSYVEHDGNGHPTGFFRHAPSGTNYNMGLDGVSPLVAGICTPEQQQLFWSRLQSEKHFWTKVGLSTVDQSAPYYRRDGYWNGAVWMPHQWFVWKAALNEGQADFAWQIASTALHIWEREVDASYYCFEHFAIASERGCGWHHFSGLSTPVLSWFGAYYRPGRLTSGYDVWTRRCDYDDATGSWSAELEIGGQTGGITTVIAVSDKGGTYRAEYAGTPCPIRQRITGVWEVDLPKACSGVLKISRG